MVGRLEIQSLRRNQKSINVYQYAFEIAYMQKKILAKNLFEKSFEIGAKN